jgi:hypothetical protein
MKDYGSTTYGDRIADVYDDWPGHPTDADQVRCFAGVAARLRPGGRCRLRP